MSLIVAHSQRLARRRALSGCDLKSGASAVPAGGLANRSRAVRASSPPAIRPACQVLGLGAINGAGNARTLLNRVTRGLDRVASVRATTRAATKRRKASAPESTFRWQHLTVWRAPRPKHPQTVTPVGVAWLLTMRLPALRLPFYFEAAVSCSGVAKLGARTKSAARD